jgi:trehalose 6-phosphate phosphatase
MDAMRELKQLRAEGVTTLAVVVRHLDTQPELLELADIVVEGVEGMVALLREIVRGNASASPKQSSSER